MVIGEGSGGVEGRRLPEAYGTRGHLREGANGRVARGAFVVRGDPIVGDFFDDLSKRLFGATDGHALKALMHPVPPFDGAGSSLVAFGSLVVLIASVAAAAFSFAGLMVALMAIYLVCAKVFGIQIDLREDFPF